MAAGHPSTATTERRSKRRLVVISSVVGGIAVLTALLGFGLSRDPTLIRSPLVGRPAPAFALPTIGDDAPTISLSQLRGQVVVVNFWASWCTGCRLEHPALEAAWDRYRDKGVVMLGIPFQDRQSASRDFLDELGGDWPNLADPSSRTAIDYGVYGLPETFVIDPRGVVTFKQVGPISYDTLTDQIERALPGGTA